MRIRLSVDLLATNCRRNRASRYSRTAVLQSLVYASTRPPPPSAGRSGADGSITRIERHRPPKNRHKKDIPITHTQAVINTQQP